jgi:alkanesulfonate monooxygenase SsuD/methylene tetrahydromethanopterin reductase-like flavin-dependent oxidoreductase (luciferase family)
MALRIASVATFALFGVLLPILFTLIYIPRTRQRMLEINGAGQRGLGRAREHIRYQFMGGHMPAELEQFLRDHEIDTSRAGRVSPPRQRVAVDTQAEALEAEDVALDSEANAKRREQR